MTVETLLQNKIFIIVMISILIKIIGHLIIRIIDKQITSVNVKHTTKRWIHYLEVFTIILVAVSVYGSQFSLATILGFISAGLALALHKILMSMAGWLYIWIKKPYDIGDRIQVGDTKGDIIDVSMIHTSLLEVDEWVEGEQSTGRITIVPNSKVFTEDIFNYTKGFRGVWNEMKVLVTFDSNKEKTEEVLNNILKEVYKKINIDKMQEDQLSLKKQYAIKPSKLTPIVYFSIQDSGYQFELRYISYARQRRSIKNEISHLIYEEFKKHDDINFAYPSQAIYMKN